MKTIISGAFATKFGELWSSSPRSLARTAALEAMKDAHTDPQSIDALFVGNMLSGILGGQEHLGAFFAEELGLVCPAFKIEGACASGGLAVHMGILGILSGIYKKVLVLGIEKMTDHKPEDVARALVGAGSESERLAGATFPGLYAILARAHMDAYGTKEEDLAMIAVKNHFHATKNSKAHFQSLLTIEKAMKSTCIADPLKLFDCSPISDGAAAVIIEQKSNKKNKKNKYSDIEISILASEVAVDTLGLSERKSLVELSATKQAAHRAFQNAHLQPSSVNVAEVHDCFTIAEIFAMEDLGFYEKGKAVEAIRNKETTLGISKKLVINPSGGLKACGHPVGATGVKQIVEIVDQLRNRCGERQVKGAHFGLTHNVGGSGATAVVHILSNT
jgi:acetyl-CoA C-acetyltransferase